MIVLLLGGLRHLVETKDYKRLLSNKTHLFTIGLFVLILGSSLVSENQAESWTRIRIALPLLVLPIAFSTLPLFRKIDYQRILSIFVYSMVLACMGVLANYFTHFDAMQEILRQSGAIPTPNGEHIRFSLMINIAVFAGIWLWRERFYWRKEKGERIGLLSSIILLVLSIHFLSVRTGLLALYTTGGVSLLAWIFYRKKYVVGTGILIGMFMMPYFAIQYIPSVRMKYELTMYNIQLFNRGEVGEYSDTQRLLSYKVALDVVKQSPWVGVGMGDLLSEQASIYQRDYPKQKVMYPHNMFLTMYAATGLLGLFYFLITVFGPLWYKRQYQHYFLLAFYCIIGCSFLTENTLLASVGVAIYTFFLGLAASVLEEERLDSTT
jgi:O-antigen ligase